MVQKQIDYGKRISMYTFYTDQTGLIKDRFIGENSRFLYVIINITETKIYLLFKTFLKIDFEEAFDDISKIYIY